MGAGYVGLVTSACLSLLGHRVIAVENDESRLDSLNRGALPIYEPGLAEAIRIGREAGLLSFAGDCRVVQDCEIAIIAVNTPSLLGGGADTSSVEAAFAEIVSCAGPGLTIAVKSTVPVGTGDRLQLLAQEYRDRDIDVVANPEFLRQGSAIADFMRPDRIVVGASSREAAKRVAGLYADIDAPVITSSRRAAELAKYVSNALLAARISFINEMALLCDAACTDIDEVACIVGLDHRIGDHYLKPGLGWGGSCLPKDVQALRAMALEYGCSPHLLEAATVVNERQPDELLTKLTSAGGLRAGAMVGILGLAFKPHTDDLRGAPSLRLISRLLDAGMRVKAHDPLAIANARRELPFIEYCHDIHELARDCDALILCTEWPEYQGIDWQRLRELVRQPVVLDGRNFLDAAAIERCDFTYLALGRQRPMTPAGAESAERLVAQLGRQAA